jgi:hypothetical protein
MVIECDFVIAKNVGQGYEPYLCENVFPNIWFLDMESVRLGTTISLKNEILQLVIT